MGFIGDDQIPHAIGKSRVLPEVRVCRDDDAFSRGTRIRETGDLGSHHLAGRDPRVRDTLRGREDQDVGFALFFKALDDPKSRKVLPVPVPFVSSIPNLSGLLRRASTLTTSSRCAGFRAGRDARMLSGSLETNGTDLSASACAAFACSSAVPAPAARRASASGSSPGRTPPRPDPPRPPRSAPSAAPAPSPDVPA